MNKNMDKNRLFFKPTSLYREFVILDFISKNKDITQRDLAIEVNISVSLINRMLNRLSKQEYIFLTYLSNKNVIYSLTKKGDDRKNLLNIWYLQSSHEFYVRAKLNIVNFLNELKLIGIKEVILYGAGEVGKAIINVLDEDSNASLIAKAIIDDDTEKIGKFINNIPIISINDTNRFPHDCILIASYYYEESLIINLEKTGHSQDKIVSFFRK